MPIEPYDSHVLAEFAHSNLRKYGGDSSTDLRRVAHDQPCCDYRFTIVRLHVPSGRMWDEPMAFLSRRHMLELLDLWNGQHPGMWQYWSK